MERAFDAARSRSFFNGSNFIEAATEDEHDARNEKTFASKL